MNNIKRKIKYYMDVKHATVSVSSRIEVKFHVVDKIWFIRTARLTTFFGTQHEIR